MTLQELKTLGYIQLEKEDFNLVHNVDWAKPFSEIMRNGNFMEIYVSCQVCPIASRLSHLLNLDDIKVGPNSVTIGRTDHAIWIEGGSRNVYKAGQALFLGGDINLTRIKILD